MKPWLQSVCSCLNIKIKAISVFGPIFVIAIIVLMYYVMEQMCMEQLLFFSVYLSKAFVDFFLSVLCSFQFTFLRFLFFRSSSSLCMYAHSLKFWSEVFSDAAHFFWNSLPCNQLDHQTHSHLSNISEISPLQAILLCLCACGCGCLCMHRVCFDCVSQWTRCTNLKKLCLNEYCHCCCYWVH